ncbi:pyridoxal-phosphate dependent enzyme [Natronomonas sp.]|uniref:pyridoxal-phosphate dependent enzyme n=1 Tax=Natronomonas sp. TaxID=2184060 RepID=UPI00397667E1
MTLRCSACGTTYEDRWRCRCGSPLRFVDRPCPSTDDPTNARIDSRDGLWAFSGFLPIDRHVSFGEGYTPLVDAEAWNATFKLEYVFPTGSFKDRGATTTLSRAVDLGVDRVLEDSSGNAGAAIATYAARAGISATIYVPADTKAPKLRAISRAGADIVRVEGSREDVTAACTDAVEAGDGWYASHAWNPAFAIGTATMAYEIAHQRDWDAPDAVVMPLGHGTMFLGAYRGFRTLLDTGWIDRLPKLLGAQAAGYAPVVEAIRGTKAAAGDNDAADGIRIRDPAQMDALVGAIDDSDGDAIAISETAVRTELDRLHESGFYVEPTCAVAPAALREYRRLGVLEPDTEVIVPLSGSGLKT